MRAEYDHQISPSLLLLYKKAIGLTAFQNESNRIRAVLVYKNPIGIFCGSLASGIAEFGLPATSRTAREIESWSKFIRGDFVRPVLGYGVDITSWVILIGAVSRLPDVNDMSALALFGTTLATRFFSNLPIHGGIDFIKSRRAQNS